MFYRLKARTLETHSSEPREPVGPHHSVGAPLARLELQLAPRALVERLPNLRMTPEPRWRSLIPFRGLEALRVAWDPVALPPAAT